MIDRQKMREAAESTTLLARWEEFKRNDVPVCFPRAGQQTVEQIFALRDWEIDRLIAEARESELERTAARLDRLEAAEAERDAARALLKRAGEALAWTVPMAAAIAGFERDCDDQFSEDFEVGRIDESRDSPSFRIRIGHLRAARAIHAEIEETIDDRS